MSVKSALLVVMYGKVKLNSQTFISLCNIAASTLNGNEHIYIFNNGPQLLNDNEGINRLQTIFEVISISQDIHNRPLSVIYNEFLSINGYDRYIIFDDDTQIPSEFFSQINESYNMDRSVELQLPKVISDTSNTQRYPKYDNIIVNEVKYIDGDKLLSIGSGLIIYKTLIDKFRKYNLSPFDERFALYGVDYSLFNRIKLIEKKYNEKFRILVSSSITHSFSAANTKFELWRKKERMIDHLLTIKYYGGSRVLRLMKLTKFTLANFRFIRYSIFIDLMKVFIKGYHPRCENYVNHKNNL